MKLKICDTLSLARQDLFIIFCYVQIFKINSWPEAKTVLIFFLQHEKLTAQLDSLWNDAIFLYLPSWLIIPFIIVIKPKSWFVYKLIFFRLLIISHTLVSQIQFCIVFVSLQQRKNETKDNIQNYVKPLTLLTF